MIPIAAFLAGALLTILLPVGLLIALVVWYWLFSVRVPDTAEGFERRGAATTANPAPGAPHEPSPPPHGV